jgi:quercetin dioxygenase-like cupin family protein
MLRLFLGLLCVTSFQVFTLEYEIQLENDEVSVARAKILPHEEIGLHRDAYPQVVVALQGGIITRLESDGTTNDVAFPTGKAVYRPIDPPDQLHKSVNNSDSPVELIIIQLKK